MQNNSNTKLFTFIILILQAFGSLKRTICFTDDPYPSSSCFHGMSSLYEENFSPICIRKIEDPFQAPICKIQYLYKTTYESDLIENLFIFTLICNLLIFFYFQLSNCIDLEETEFDTNLYEYKDRIINKIDKTPLDNSDLPIITKEESTKNLDIKSTNIIQKFTPNLEYLIEKNNDPKSLFEDFILVGKGSFGEVYKTIYKKSKQECAIKVMDKKYERYNSQEVANEIQALKTLDHPYVIKSFGAYETENEIWITMEYMNGGNLLGIIKNISFKEDQIASICYYVLNALDYIHRLSRIHRDIKTDNILINSQGEIKLADFGFCCVDTGYENQIAGTADFMAPEVVKSQIYSSKIDIWSVGIMVIEMADQDTPFIEAVDNDEVLQKIKSLEISPTVKDIKMWSSEFLDFLSKCLDLNPIKRSSAIELLNHIFIQKRCNNDFIIRYLNEYNLIK